MGIESETKDICNTITSESVTASQPIRLMQVHDAKTKTIEAEGYSPITFHLISCLSATLCMGLCSATFAILLGFLLDTVQSFRHHHSLYSAAMCPTVKLGLEAGRPMEVSSRQENVSGSSGTL